MFEAIVNLFFIVLLFTLVDLLRNKNELIWQAKIFSVDKHTNPFIYEYFYKNRGDFSYIQFLAFATSLVDKSKLFE